MSSFIEGKVPGGNTGLGTDAPGFTRGQGYSGGGQVGESDPGMYVPRQQNQGEDSTESDVRGKIDTYSAGDGDDPASFGGLESEDSTFHENSESVPGGARAAKARSDRKLDGRTTDPSNNQDADEEFTAGEGSMADGGIPSSGGGGDFKSSDLGGPKYTRETQNDM